MKRLIMFMAMFVMCCAAANAEGAWPDGEYAPAEFTFSGGTGRVEITCPQVTVKGGDATATIVFDSPNYRYIKVDEVEYTTECDGETSSAEIPVRLNESMEIIGMTTAMSAEHEVEYTIYIGMEASDGDLPGLAREGGLELKYARGFTVDYYEGGYAVIDVKDSARYLVVPEDTPVPEGLDPSMAVIKQPLDSVYLAATSAMALFDALGALDSIRMVGTDKDGWYIENAVVAMKNGDMVFAGKYSEPDFEMLVSEKCDLAIESTMILHNPAVKEMIELLGIPVFIDRASYEPHPLGRTEWIKLYGVMLGREDAAAEFFESQARVIDELAGFENTGKTVAFCYISSDGSAVVRSSADYVPAMIEIAGGRYVFDDLSDPDSSRSSISISMEEFYAAAVDADYLIYNSTIDEPITGIDGLLAKSPLFADFKAVKEGNVWCTGKYLYQATDIVGNLITDINLMLTGQEEGMTFLYRLN